MKPRSSPRLATWLLEHLADRYGRDALIGDLTEEHARRRSSGWYWWQVLRALAASARRGRSKAWLWAEVARAIGAGMVLAVRARGAPRARMLWRDYRGVAAFLVLMLGFRSAWADWVYVPSGSMNPTVLEGDRLLVDKHAYGLRVPFTLVHLTWGRNPARGDIVVLDSPADGTTLLKRVVAIPGDAVALQNERLIVNGREATYTAGDRSVIENLLEQTRAQDPIVLNESGTGVAHDILLLPGRWAPSTFGPLVVPKGMYFVLGDNRDNSADSRYIGLVPRRNIVGRATRVIVSLNPDRYDLPRSSRLLTPLR